ncbi:MAG: quinone oxidoreductase, partial [Verrucomicrobiales bacterium]
MKAMRLNAYGEDAEFSLAELEVPALKPGHVRVKIEASSVNTVDTMIRRMGGNLPLSPPTP